MLAPGQRLVSKDGDLWRWDGYSVQAGTASAAGARLIERSRLGGAQGRKSARPKRTPPKPRPSSQAAAGKAETAQLKTKALRQEAKDAHAELDRMRDAIAAAEHEAQVEQQGSSARSPKR